MTAQTIDGARIAADVREQVRLRAQRLHERGIVAGLAVVLVGENPASRIYVRNKIKASAAAGIESSHVELPETSSQGRLLSTIERLNRDPRVHGILVQLPLPATIDSRAVIEAIDPDKDVDAFHPRNVGALMIGAPLFVPCTPLGVMRLIESTGIALRGARAVVVGASNIVGKPQAMLLLQAGATITICNSKTRDLAAHTREADVVVAAVGRPRMITGDMIGRGAVVVDVGINRLADGKLCGDVDFATVSERAGWITPVPGGVGPMTIAMLLSNTLTAAERRA
jgi:methylenetetrahydrofolate dehydrogenase (NADP+)/methenyltetrahydrofolate cyclohydrolase